MFLHRTKPFLGSLILAFFVEVTLEGSFHISVDTRGKLLRLKNSTLESKTRVNSVARNILHPRNSLKIGIQTFLKHF